MSTKKSMLLVVGIIVIAIALMFGGGSAILGSVATTFSTYSVSQSCAQATATYTFGAQEGQCFVKTLNNQQKVFLVTDVEEKTRYGPEGLGSFCSIEYLGDETSVLSCDKAFRKDGTKATVCHKDSDCPNWVPGSTNGCVNYMCRDTPVSVCSDTGALRCMSPKTYEQCLSNGHWSGILSCTGATTCKDVVGCTTSGTGNEGEVPGSTEIGNDITKFITDNMWLIVGLGALLIIVSLLG